MLYRYLLTCFFITIGVFPSSAQIESAKLISKNVVRYEKAEWDIVIPASFRNPYDQKEVALDMILTSPSGKPVLLPCYYENGSLWKARFAAQEIGEYSCFFRLTTTSGVIESPVQHFTSHSGNKAGFLHKNDLWTFKFDNGQLFRGIGENVGWESRSFEEDKWTYDYLLPTLSNNGANFFRTWMCWWNLPLEWQKVGNTKRYESTDEYFHPGGIKRMEELLALTDSLGLYFMLTLDMNSGNWQNSPYNKANGGPIKEWKEFFTSQKAMDKYKNKLRYVVGRWGYSTNIAAWEFFNEIDNGVFTRSDSVIIPHTDVTIWHQELSRYLKDIDPYGHLVTTSISHRDILGLNSIAYIDFNQKHIYKHTEKIPGIYPDYIQTFGKPYVIGEFGYRWEDQDPKYAKEANYDYKRGLWYGLFSPTPILPMSWWWELFDDQKMTPYFRGVRQISDRMLKSGKGSFEPFEVSAGKLHAQGVKCGDEYFIYLLNNTDREVSESVIPQTGTGKRVIVQAFSPETKSYTPLRNYKVSGSRLEIDNVKLPAYNEMILIISGK